MILRSTKLNKLFSIFKELRNKTQNLILNAIRNYFKDKLESEKKLNHYGSLSRTWVCHLRRAKPLQVILASKLMAKVTEKFNSFYTFVLQLLQNLWRSYHRVLTNIVSEYDQEIPQVWKEG